MEQLQVFIEPSGMFTWVPKMATFLFSRPEFRVMKVNITHLLDCTITTTCPLDVNDEVLQVFRFLSAGTSVKQQALKNIVARNFVENIS